MDFRCPTTRQPKSPDPLPCAPKAPPCALDAPSAEHLLSMRRGKPAGAGKLPCLGIRV